MLPSVDLTKFVARRDGVGHLQRDLGAAKALLKRAMAVSDGENLVPTALAYGWLQFEDLVESNTIGWRRHLGW
jgi:hypothetical protein